MMVCALLLYSSVTLAAQESQTPAAPVTANFAFPTIKPSKLHQQGHRFRVTGNRFEARNASLSDLLCFAYGLHATQITGAPAWAHIDKYDLAAVADPDGQQSESFWRNMLQKLIAESFQLQFHRENEDLPFYVLTVSNTGPGLVRSNGDPNGLPELTVTLGAKNAASETQAVISARNASVEDLASVLQRLVLDWPVIDQTEIAGRYDFLLRWTPTGSQFGDARSSIPARTEVNAPPDLLAALQRQLGLKLEIRHAPTEVLVVDSVEKPSDNAPDPARSYRAFRSSGTSPATTRLSPFSTELNSLFVTNNLY
jgi:uncharacterized protein (TIGR03435 family)